MPAKNHVHKYRLINRGSKEKPKKVYACALPDCTHFMPKMIDVLGKKTICWKCLKETIMSAYILKHKRVHPVCSGCKDTNRAKRLGHKVAEQPADKVKFDNALDMVLAMRGVTK